MKFVVKIGRQYVAGFSNTHYQPILVDSVCRAYSTLTRKTMELWAEKYLGSYKWNVVELN